MKAQKVWFETHTIGDPLLSINGANYPGPVVFLPAIPPSLAGQFWVEPDTQGTPRLCTFKTNLDTPTGAQFIDSITTLPYNIFAKNFSIVLNQDSEQVEKPQ